MEEPKHRNEIVQCKWCQSYAHTKSYCNLKPWCIKCVGSHLSVNCKKPRNESHKCVLCEEAHPANYRGCIVHKELKRLRQHPLLRSPKFYCRSDGQWKTLVTVPQPIQHDQTIPAHSHLVLTLTTSMYIITTTNNTPLLNAAPYNSAIPEITSQLVNF